MPGLAPMRVCTVTGILCMDRTTNCVDWNRGKQKKKKQASSKEENRNRCNAVSCQKKLQVSPDTDLGNDSKKNAIVRQVSHSYNTTATVALFIQLRRCPLHSNPNAKLEEHILYMNY